MTVTVNMEEVMEMESSMGKGTRKPSDINAPKRALSAFFLWANKTRPSVIAAHPEWGVADVGRELGSMWKKVSSSEKAGFEAKHAKAKKIYESKMESYKKSKDYKKFQTELLAYKIHQTKKPFAADPNAPKRPLSAYMLYSASVRSEIIKANPDMAAAQVMQEQGARWKALSESDRAPWIAKSEAAKKKYERLVLKYQNTNDYQKYINQRNAYKADMIAKRNRLMGIKKRARSEGGKSATPKKAKRSTSRRSTSVRRARTPKASRSRSGSKTKSSKTRRRAVARRARAPKGSKRASRKSASKSRSTSRRSARRARTPKKPKKGSRSKSRASSRRSSRRSSSSRSRRASTPKGRSKKKRVAEAKKSRRAARRARTPKKPKKRSSTRSKSRTASVSRRSSRSSKRSSRRARTPKGSKKKRRAAERATKAKSKGKRRARRARTPKAPLRRSSSRKRDREESSDGAPASVVEVESSAM